MTKNISALYSLYRNLFIAFSSCCMTSATLNAQMSSNAIVCNEDPYLLSLPESFLPFEEFVKKFSLGSSSTEQQHPLTKRLSGVMQRSITDGLELLLQVDATVIDGFESFIPTITAFAPSLADKISQGGRIFLVGAGSSGRVGMDIAAKCAAKFPKIKGQIQSIVAGGDSAFVRGVETYEDSETEGEEALKDLNLGSNDIVILISASGSASYNVGSGHFAADKGASVFYFYNTKNIPLRTQRLFERKVNPVIPFCLDIGPQAICGSTRLQAATLAEACLGALIGSVFFQSQEEKLLSDQYPIELSLNMKKGWELINSKLHLIQKFPQLEVKVFSNPDSSFRQLTDVSDQGYFTFVAMEDSIREVLIDSTETSPTFSTHPILRESENYKKRAEFRAYLLGQRENRKAWQALLGRNVNPRNQKDTDNFLLSCEEEGIYSFSNRPKSKGNFLVGVAKINESEPIPETLIKVLDETKKQGGFVGLLLICRGKFSQVLVKELEETYDAVLIIENTPSDALGVSETIVLKQVLNLISNSSMVLMNKVHGNKMIDVSASNKKLIDRSMRLIKDILLEFQPDKLCSDKFLYHYVAHVSELKESFEEKGIYTPSVVKIVLAMIALNKTPENFQEVVLLLADKQERIDLLW